MRECLAFMLENGMCNFSLHDTDSVPEMCVLVAVYGYYLIFAVNSFVKLHTEGSHFQ